jgi:hypothetical protein
MGHPARWEGIDKVGGCQAHTTLEMQILRSPPPNLPRFAGPLVRSGTRSFRMTGLVGEVSPSTSFRMAGAISMLFLLGRGWLLFHPCCARRGHPSVTHTTLEMQILRSIPPNLPRFAGPHEAAGDGLPGLIWISLTTFST